jgi:hypothetical protein
MLRELAARVGSLVWIPLFVKMPSPPGDNPHVAHFLKMLDEPWETRYKVRGILTDPELFWRKIHRWLQEQGYELRPRYHSDWEPSWLKTGRNRDKCEDGYRNRVSTERLLELPSQLDVSLAGWIYPRRRSIC